MAIRDNQAVNGNGGAFVSVACTIPCRKMVIDEDPVTGAAQGLDYQLADEGFAVTHSIAAGEQITLGDTVAHGAGRGPMVGYGAQRTAGEVIAADSKVKVRSHTAAATTMRISETE